MKKLLVLPILCLFVLVCIKPDRDNEYDPNNPSKAHLEGTVYGFEGIPVDYAQVALTYDDADTIVQDTDNKGRYGFENVNPGIYTVLAQGDYYGPRQHYPESLAAGTKDTLDIYFHTAFWDFEDEEVNTPEPRGFNVLDGTWAVVDDPDQGYVYQGITPGTGLAVVTTIFGVRDFYYESSVKVDPVSGTSFYMGLIFRHQDPQNFYLVFCTSDTIALIEAHNGTWNTVDVVARTFLLDTWYLLAVDCSGNRIQVFVDNETTPTFDVTNNTFPGGRAGLFAEHNTTVYFDDVYIDITE